MSIVRRCINLPHCSRPYSWHKCSGNLYFGLKPVITTIAPPGPEEAPSPLFCSPPVERSLREPEIRSWGWVKNIFFRWKPETLGQTVPNGGRWRRPSLPGCKSDYLHSPLIWYVRYEYFSWRKHWHLVNAKLSHLRMAGMFRLYSQFGLVMAPDRYFWGSGSLPKNYVQSLELDVIADLCTAQAGGGTDHSRWRAGCPISRAASSTPKIKFVTLSLYSK